MSFLRNCWYVAAHAGELDDGAFLRRTFLGEDVVLFRDGEHAPHALANRCPHRFAPLHMGRLKDGRIECAYHGLQFAGTGECVHNPHGVVPRAARVRAYPVIERQGLLWIWPGDPAVAASRPVPEYGSLDGGRWEIQRGYIRIEAHYLLETDNILDLSHIEFVHPGFFGSEAIRRAKTSVEQDGHTVYSKRLTHDEILPPFLDASFGANGRPVDRWLNSRWDPPALIELDVGATLTGRPHAEGRSIPTCHFFTPISESATHYFWTYSRDYDKDNAALDAEIVAGVSYAFEQQDKPIIEAQQAVIGNADLLAMRPVMLAGDAAGVRVRRIVEKLLTEEQAAGAAVTTTNVASPG